MILGELFKAKNLNWELRSLLGVGGGWSFNLGPRAW
jgi:hypothetical protein